MNGNGGEEIYVTIRRICFILRSYSAACVVYIMVCDDEGIAGILRFQPRCRFRLAHATSITISSSFALRRHFQLCRLFAFSMMPLSLLRRLFCAASLFLPNQ